MSTRFRTCKAAILSRTFCFIRLTLHGVRRLSVAIRVTLNPSKYGLTNDQVEKRRGFVHGVRQKLAAYRPSATTRGGNSQTDQRAQLLGATEDRVAQEAAAAELREENDDFIGGEQLRRALIEREQDEVLDDLGKSVTRLGAMGIHIDI